MCTLSNAGDCQVVLMNQFKIVLHRGDILKVVNTSSVYYSQKREICLKAFGLVKEKKNEVKWFMTRKSAWVKELHLNFIKFHKEIKT